MSDKLKPELSKKSPYWIPKYRYYELKYVCLQYDYYKSLYLKLKFYPERNIETAINRVGLSDPTSDLAEKKLQILSRLEIIEEAAQLTDPELAVYILRAVTKGLSFEALGPPCSRSTFYDRYRKFFFILSHKLHGV